VFTPGRRHPRRGGPGGGGGGVFSPKTSTRQTRGPKMHKPGLIPLAD
jgi:hypothetical protein